MDLKRELESLGAKSPGYIRILREHDKSQHQYVPTKKYTSPVKGFNTLEQKIEKMLKDVQEKEEQASKVKAPPSYDEYWKMVLDISKEVDESYDEENDEIKSSKKYICIDYDVYNIIADACPGCHKSLESYGIGRLGRLVAKKDFQSVIEKIRKKFAVCNYLTHTVDGDLLFITDIDISFSRLLVKESSKESVQATIDEYRRTQKIKRYDEKGKLITD